MDIAFKGWKREVTERTGNLTAHIAGFAAAFVRRHSVEPMAPVGAPEFLVLSEQADEPIPNGVHRMELTRGSYRLTLDQIQHVLTKHGILPTHPGTELCIRSLQFKWRSTSL